MQHHHQQQQQPQYQPQQPSHNTISPAFASRHIPYPSQGPLSQPGTPATITREMTPQQMHQHTHAPASSPYLPTHNSVATTAASASAYNSYFDTPDASPSTHDGLNSHSLSHTHSPAIPAAHGRHIHHPSYDANATATSASPAPGSFVSHYSTNPHAHASGLTVNTGSGPTPGYDLLPESQTDYAKAHPNPYYQQQQQAPQSLQPSQSAYPAYPPSPSQGLHGQQTQTQGHGLPSSSNGNLASFHSQQPQQQQSFGSNGSYLFQPAQSTGGVTASPLSYSRSFAGSPLPGSGPEVDELGRQLGRMQLRASTPGEANQHYGTGF
jgi:hypothetical protein